MSTAKLAPNPGIHLLYGFVISAAASHFAIYMHNIGIKNLHTQLLYMFETSGFRQLNQIANSYVKVRREKWSKVSSQGTKCQILILLIWTFKETQAF